MSHFTVVESGKLTSYHLSFSNEEIFTSYHNVFHRYYSSKEDIIKAYETGQTVGHTTPDRTSIFYKKQLKNTNFPFGALVEISSNFAVSYDKFFNLAKNFDKPNNNVATLPIATRYISTNGKYFIERPPFQATINFHQSGAKEGSRSEVNDVNIWVPWTLTVIDPKAPHDSMIMFSPESLKDEKTQYVPSILPNTYDNGRICFSNSLLSLDLSSATIKYQEYDIRYLYSLIINDYFGGGWNTDLTSNAYGIFHNIQLAKKYSGLNKFLSITAEELKNVHPRMRANTANAIIDYKYSNNIVKMYKYIFYAFSVMSLEETLNFYKDMITFCKDYRSGDKIIAFQQLVANNIAHDTSIKYSQLPSKIIAELGDEVDYSVAGSRKNAYILVANYNNNQQLIDAIRIDGSYYNIFSRSIKAYPPHLLNEVLYKIATQQEYVLNHVHVYVMDIDNNSITEHLVSNSKTKNPNVLNYETFCNNYITENHILTSTDAVHA